jgi:hypothetical protein
MSFFPLGILQGEAYLPLHLWRNGSTAKLSPLISTVIVPQCLLLENQ